MTEAEMTRLYTEYGYVLFRRCLVYLGDEAAAQDTVQEVFVRALDPAPTPSRAQASRNDANPRTWLCRIADQLCVERLRRVRRAEPVRASTVVTEEEDHHFGSAGLASAIMDDDRESFLAVQRLLAGLEPETRRLAVLHYLDEHTQDEIARELGRSRRVIQRRLRALEQHARAHFGEEQRAVMEPLA